MFEIVLPRLFQLYSESEQDNPINYFKDFEKRILCGDREFLHAVIDVEKDLSFLDQDAWNSLKAKCLPYVCNFDSKKHRGWSQLINCFREAKGYIFLKNENYNNISFIDISRQETPDLIGLKDGKWTLLEVKCINQSHICLENIFDNNCVEVKPEISLGFKEKIMSTAKKAKSQLMKYSQAEMEFPRRICLFIIDVDLDFHIDPHKFKIVENFMSECKSNIHEIELQFQILPPYGFNNIA